jgi:two-component system LytT family sensor kinase
MIMRADIRKQLGVALYSSVAVSLLTTTPVFMMTRIPFAYYPWTLVFTTLITVAMWGLNILLFYFSQGRRVFRYAASYVVCVLIAVGMLHGIVFPRMEGGFSPDGRGFWFHVILFISVDTVLLILQDLVVIRERKAAVELENAQLRMRNIEAANLLLKQQVQPHFLFNSLSTLKSLIKYSPADAEEYVVKLSGFLRSSMAAHAAALVTVEEELGLCRDYLEMQRIRFGEALQYSVSVEAAGFLPVFALQGLIENAIKHNMLTKEQPLQIRLVGDEKRIVVTNNLQLRDGVETGGMGLVNLQERYKALGAGEVVVEKSETIFSVSISVLAHEHRDHRG